MKTEHQVLHLELVRPEIAWRKKRDFLQFIFWEHDMCGMPPSATLQCRMHRSEAWHDKSEQREGTMQAEGPKQSGKRGSC